MQVVGHILYSGYFGKTSYVYPPKKVNTIADVSYNFLLASSLLPYFLPDSFSSGVLFAVWSSRLLTPRFWINPCFSPKQALLFLDLFRFLCACSSQFLSLPISYYFYALRFFYAEYILLSFQMTYSHLTYSCNLLS